MLEKWKEHKIAFWIFALPGTLWLAIFFFVPLGIVWVLSFSQQVSLTKTVFTGSLEHYIRAFEDPVYLKIIWKSVWISALATFICFLTACPLAFLLSFVRGRVKTIMLAAIIMPFWVNLLIRVYALIALFRTRGFINYSLEGVYNFLSLDVIFGDFHPLELLYNDAAVILGLIYAFLPFMTLPLYASMERLDKSLLEASLDLGASQFITFLKIIFPLTMPGVISGITLVFIPMLGSFLIPDLLGGAGAQMIGNVIERQFKAANNHSFGAALSFLLIYITFGALAVRSWLSGRAGRRARSQ